MSSATRRLLPFFLSIFALASCEDPTEIGIELQDENLIGTTYTEYEVKTGTVLLSDSIPALRSVPALLGKFNDPVLGSSAATTFTEVGLNAATALKFGDNPVATSLELTLDYSNIYGDKSKPLTINLYQLKEGFDEKTSYFKNSSLPYEKLLGSATIIPELVKKKGTVNDSTIAKTFVKIQLSQEFTQSLISKSGTGDLASQQAFNTFLKGLAIVPANDAASMLALKLTADSTKMVLRYMDGTTPKKHTFLLGSQRYFSNITTNRTGTAVAALTNNRDFVSSESTGDLSYVQTNTQLLSKLNFPELEKLKEKLGDIIINRAELILPVQNGSDATFTPVPQFVLYQTNNTNRIIRNAAGTALTVQQDVAYALNGTTSPATLQYNSEKKQYSLNMTSYIQAILLGTKPNMGLLLAPARVQQEQGGGLSISPEPLPYRTILSNPATGTMKAKLLIYYSKIEK